MIFRQATVRLTVLFTVVLLVLFGAFALGVYVFVTSSFDYDSVASTGSTAVDAAEQSFADLRHGLTVGYLALVVVVPFLSYGMVKLVLRPASRGYEAQQRFVDDASHELRTPLSIIQGELELAVSRPRAPSDYEAAISTALDEVDHLNTLTNDLLLLSRGTALELTAAFQPVRLSVVAERAVGAARRENPARRIDTPSIPNDELIVVGSESLLARAIGNLVDNALKFSADSASVAVAVAQLGERATVVVSDSGRGLSSEELSHAFDRFWRSEASRSMPGRGLGLSLVKQIVEAHRGTVRMHSDGTSGTQVIIELPLARE